jgi:hypothetical protein
MRTDAAVQLWTEMKLGGGGRRISKSLTRKEVFLKELHHTRYHSRLQELATPRPSECVSLICVCLSVSLKETWLFADRRHIVYIVVSMCLSFSCACV